MSHKVTLKPSGHTFQVPDGATILNAGLEAKYIMPYSCKTGVCRTCRGVIEEGTVDYGMVHPTYLTESDKAEGYALLCAAKPLSDLVITVEELDGLAGIEPRLVPARIATIERPVDDVAVLQLRLHPNENMRFLAGQYVDVLLPDGDTRSYSIASKPLPDGVIALELHLRHSPGGKFTDHVFSDMQTRDLLRFKGPLGTFYIREDSRKPIVMVASGTGFAPIKSMCEYLIDKEICAERPITLYWGCRAKQDLYMLDLPQSWSQDVNGFTFHPVLSEPTQECDWSGRTGFVHEAVCNDFPDMSAIQVYACGNPAMIDAARDEFINNCGLPHSEFFADAFLTALEKNPEAIKTE
ncbi:MAG: CDP-6-deoxy-delta-3,4-glucoseen reductase [Pseudomonadota bacterium]